MAKNSHDPSKDDLLNAERKVTPGTRRFLYAGISLLALAAVVLSGNKAPGALLGVATILVVLATIVSLLTSALARRHSMPALLSLWAVLSISILVALLFLSSLFLGIPERGAVFVARLLGDPRLAISSSNASAVVIESEKETLPDVFQQWWSIDLPDQ
ncbi:hypothetical protein [Bradyrhizobium cenepequi]|uniref:hypothetical protein n=1 Tax=Bradyrhizobium cenepequi TaxID=2821403 RepID=UPI001CE2F20A|nr:hypothetical protein [Bradyrhizobium cenepequi]MCA6112852.1 hypothetical protein [Bradyrhizobium cenepequi]